MWAFYTFQSLVLKKTYFKDTFATITPWNNWAEIMLSWKEDWSIIKRKIKLFKGDAIKTTTDSSEVEYPWNNHTILDKNTSLILENLLADNSFSEIRLSIWEGRVWAKVWRMINPKSSFLISAENIEISSKWWVFSIEWNWIRVIEWSADVNIKEWTKSLWQLTVWVGQELILTDKLITSTKLWNLPELRAISDEFKLSSWYNNNYRNKWEVKNNVASNVVKVVTTTWSTNSTWAKLEWEKEAEENVTKEEPANIEKTKHIWEIAFDFEEWKEIEIEKTEMITINWKVPTNVTAVSVNDWKLTQFKQWNISFKYNAALKWKNLEEWENVFIVKALDKDWDLIKEWKLTLNIKIKKEEAIEEVKEEIKEEEMEVEEVTEEEKIEEKVLKVEEKTENNLENAWLSFQITSHKEWESVKVWEWEALEIKWIPPSNAVKITVWNYELKSFKEWNSEFLFRVAEEWGNMTRWATNKYSIEALDEDWKLIEEIKFTIFIEE